MELADTWKQLLGICTALKKIHGFEDVSDRQADGNAEGRLCIHFDLKPDNILIERENGNWLITDFGQAALTERRRGTTPRVGGHFGTDAYAPPEIDDTSMEFGRAYDIWSLGCIMLEVTTFMVLGYVGLKGTNDFVGLDQARQAMPSWARNGDERFFYQELPNGDYVVKKEIQEFMTSLERRHGRSTDSDEQSKAFLTKILDLINRMLKPKVSERVNISRVVDIFSSAIKIAIQVPFERRAHKVIPAPGEEILGGTELNRIELWHRSATTNGWEPSNLEVLENRAGSMRLHCWAHGHEPNNTNFRRSDVKMLPLYAFWDPAKVWESRTWIDFLFLSSNQASEVANAKFSFDGNSGLIEARLVQSILTSQKIVDSFGLSQLVLNKPTSMGDAIKGLFRKMKQADANLPPEGHKKSMDLGSATVQIWVEEETVVPTQLSRRESLLSQATDRTSTVRHFDRYDQKVPPCRVAIYLHRHRFICTVKIDANWVLEESTTDDKVLLFTPNPPGRGRHFYASWVRPTPDEHDAGCPAGIPLSPKVLQYYEDNDWLEVEDLKLTFLSAEDRENFKWKFWEIKCDWDTRRRKVEDVIPVNRMPEGPPQLPDGLSQPPLPAKKARFAVFPENPKDPQSTTSTSASGSRHDSAMDNNTAAMQNPNHLMVPPR
jgi:serine/threonine protein kinase